MRSPIVNSIACDDGRVEKLGGKRLYTIIVCVAYRGRVPVDLAVSRVRIDGLDSTSIISGLVMRLEENVRLENPAILLDTIIYAGFNIVSLDLLKRLTGLDVIAFYPYKPDKNLLIDTILRHLDWAPLRSRLIEEQLSRLRKIETEKGVVYVVSTIEEERTLADIVGYYQIYTRHLEPLRVAHMAASSISKLLGKVTH